MSKTDHGRRGFPLRPFSVLLVFLGLGAAMADDAPGRHQQLLEQVAAAVQPPTPYLVIDTRDNVVRLHDREHRVLREATAATGAARSFQGPKRWKHNWNFATPSGRFSVLRKVEDPLWVRPEWAFLEADEEIPVFAEDPRRFQRGVLGRYALYFAKDLMIHGTLYEVNLGKSITHGCVRVGAEDLAWLYEHVDVGWPVYIY